MLNKQQQNPPCWGWSAWLAWRAVQTWVQRAAVRWTKKPLEEEEKLIKKYSDTTKVSVKMFLLSVFPSNRNTMDRLFSSWHLYRFWRAASTAPLLSQWPPWRSRWSLQQCSESQRWAVWGRMQWAARLLTLWPKQRPKCIKLMEAACCSSSGSFCILLLIFWMRHCFFKQIFCFWMLYSWKVFCS